MRRETEDGPGRAVDWEELGLKVGPPIIHIDFDPRPRWWRVVKLFRWWRRQRKPKGYARITGIHTTPLKLRKD